MKRRLASLLGPLLLAALLGLARDAGADGATRPATAQERAFHQTVLAALDRAVPAGPSGWEQVERSSPAPLDRLDQGAESRPLRVSFTAAWQDAAKLAEAEGRSEAALQLAGAEFQAGRGRDLQEVSRQMEALAERFAAALQRGDAAETARLQARMTELSDQAAGAGGEMDAAATAVSREHAARDARASVTIEVNVFEHEAGQGEVKRQPPVAGRPVQRTAGEFDAQYGLWREGQSLVLLGAWTAAASDGRTTFTAVPRPGAPSAAVQTILVRVQADDARARRLLESMDWRALEGLLTK